MTRILLVTHTGLGEAFREVAAAIFDGAVVSVFSVRADEDREDAVARLAGELRAAGDCRNLLVLTDLPGATPHNVARAAVAAACPDAPLVTGLNVPMLLRALNHARRPAGELAELAVEGGRRAVFAGDPDDR